MVFVPLVLGALSVELRTFVNAKTAAQLFPVEYQTHGLAQYPFKAQLKYLHYALFVRALRDHGYSHASMAKLLSFAEIARLPEAPAFRLSQHPGFIYLMGILTPLASNFIKTSPPGRVAEQPQ
jgi:hypothetical protein